MSSSHPSSVLLIGAGIAGLSTALSLRRKGVDKVTVLEAEDFPFSHASGRNAAIYRPLESDPLLTELALETEALLRDLSESAREPLLVQRGLVLLDQDPRLLERTHQAAGRVGLPAIWLEGRRALRETTGLALEHTGPALWSPRGGVLDPHEIAQALMRKLVAQGVEISFGEEVCRLLTDGRGHVSGAQLASGKSYSAEAVVIAAGARSARFALGLDAPTPLVPLQRHLALLEAPPGALPAEAPVVWCLQPEFYFRPEAGGVLVSPCDETPAPSAVPSSDLQALSPLHDHLAALFPALSQARVKSCWACIRTKGVDGRPLLGPDPHVPGLYFVTGLAGFGMSCGLALAERFAELFVGASRADARTLPARFRLPWLKGKAHAAE